MLFLIWANMAIFQLYSITYQLLCTRLDLFIFVVSLFYVVFSRVFSWLYIPTLDAETYREIIQQSFKTIQQIDERYKKWVYRIMKCKLLYLLTVTWYMKAI